MILRKWNYSKHDYEPYEVPDDWNVKAYSGDMSEIVNCPHCGKRVQVGETYASREIHNDVGFGYSVCRDCYYNREVWWDSNEE